MDEERIAELCEAIDKILDGEEYETAMIVLGTLHSELAVLQTRDENALRSLYAMMAEGAVLISKQDPDGIGRYSFQTEEDASQTEEGEEEGSETGNEPGPFGVH